MGDVLPLTVNPIHDAFNTQLEGIVNGLAQLTQLTNEDGVPEFNAFMESLDTPDQIQKLREKVAALAENADLIDGYFRDILSHPTEGTNFKDTWNSHYTTFQVLHEQSQKTARQLGHHLDDFLDSVVPALGRIQGRDDQVNRNKAIEAIERFLKDSGGTGDDRISLTKFEEKGDEHSNGFCRLSLEVKLFEDFKATPGVKVNGALTKIMLSDKELSGLTGIGTRSLTVIQTIMSTVKDFGLVVWGALRHAGSLVYKLIAAIVEFISRVLPRKEAIPSREASAKLGNEEDTKAVPMNDLESASDKLAETLQKLSELWTGLAANASTLKNALQKGVDHNPEPFEVFQQRVKRCKKQYILLRLQINAYTHQI